LKVEHEILDTCEAKLTIEVDPMQIEEARRKAARKLAGQYAIPGFRKGKAPYEIVVRHFGDGAVMEAALDDLAQIVYEQALDETKLEPVGPGQMTEAKLDPPVFTFMVPLRPEIDLGVYRETRLGYTEATVTEEALNDALEHQREHEAILEPVERESQIGDVLTVDVVGKVILGQTNTSSEAASGDSAPEAEAQPEVSGETATEPTEEFLMDDKDVEVVLDPKLNWPAPGFAEKVAGLKADESRHVELTFPEDYANESLRGKLAHFEVTCKGVKSRTLPEWDDELAKSLGYESLADLRTKVHDSLLAQAKRRLTGEYSKSVLDIVVAGSTVKYPPYLFDREIEEMTEDLDRRLREQNLTLDDYKKVTGRTDEQIREELEPSARERLRRSLVLSKVIEVEGLTVDDDTVNTRIDLLASLLGKDANKYRKMMRTDTARRSIRYDLLSDLAVQRLVAIAKGENPPLPGSIEILSEPGEPAPETALNAEVAPESQTQLAEIPAPDNVIPSEETG
jgi:trigger factor